MGGNPQGLILSREGFIMIEPKNCPRRGVIFIPITDKICKECVKAEEETYEKVRTYVRDNPHQGLQAVADACEVSVKRLLVYLQDGRLHASEGMDGELTCSKCGKAIRTGRMCEHCVLEVGFTVRDMKQEAAERNRLSGKYHTTNQTATKK